MDLLAEYVLEDKSSSHPLQGMQTGIERAHRDSGVVCTAICAEAHVRRAVHTACRPTAQGSALGLCQGDGHWPQS